MLYNYVVTPGWVSADAFLFGFVIINILPGPNFNFGPYCAGLSFVTLLAISRESSAFVPTIILGSLLGYFGIFFPGLCVKTGILPVWKTMRNKHGIRIFLKGVGFCAVGLIFSAVVTIWLELFQSDPDAYWFAAVAICSFVGSFHLDIHPVTLVLCSFGVTIFKMFGSNH
jgi:chromate transport protein ChrA